MDGFDSHPIQPLDKLESRENQLSSGLESISLLQETLPDRESTAGQFLPDITFDGLVENHSLPEQLPDVPSTPRHRMEDPVFISDSPTAEILKGNNQVMLVGDEHYVTDAKDLVIDMMSQIQTLGLTDSEKPALVLEVVPEDLQESINELNPDQPDPEILDRVRSSLRKGNNLDIGDDSIDSYVNMILAARKAGVEMICPEPTFPQDIDLYGEQLLSLLDSNDEFRQSLQDFINNSDPELVKKAMEHIGEFLRNQKGHSREEVDMFFDGLSPLRDPPRQLPDPLNRDTFKDDFMINWRDDRFITAINNQLNHGQNVIMFAGFGHYGTRDSGESIEEAMRDEGSINVSNYGFQLPQSDS